MEIPKLNPLTAEDIFRDISIMHREEPDFLKNMKDSMGIYNPNLLGYLSEGQCSGCAPVMIYSQLQRQLDLNGGSFLPEVTEGDIERSRLVCSKIKVSDIPDELENRDPTFPEYITALHNMFSQTFIPLKESAAVVKMYESLKSACYRVD